ncbi:MAG: hypothetical protein KKE50_03020 [Nanoarchaeota archaeon]|nr:hypothetical protein [Nanoarchaeota archaeon]
MKFKEEVHPESLLDNTLSWIGRNILVFGLGLFLGLGIEGDRIKQFEKERDYQIQRAEEAYGLGEHAGHLIGRVEGYNLGYNELKGQFTDKRSREVSVSELRALFDQQRDANGR